MTDLWGSLLRRGLRLGLDRGLLGGSPPWLVLGGLALLGYLLSRAMERHPEVVIRVRPGTGRHLRGHRGEALAGRPQVTEPGPAGGGVTMVA